MLHSLTLAGALTLAAIAPGAGDPARTGPESDGSVLIEVPRADLDRCRETLAQVLGAPLADARTLRAASPGLPQARCVAE